MSTKYKKAKGGLRGGDIMISMKKTMRSEVRALNILVEAYNRRELDWGPALERAAQELGFFLERRGP